uniref:Uncharacterized protein n=1 Tax=Anopheles arabiensis TaxID=7173 RepID=A0A182ICL3_ANOAR
MPVGYLRQIERCFVL